MSEVSNLEQIAEPTTPSLAQRLSLGVLRRWWVTAIALSGCALGAGALGLYMLLQQPPKANCESIFWPFASASVRISCAQEFAQKHTLEDLFEAISLVDSLPKGHPLRPLINRWVEIWAKEALDLAEEEFHSGNLERAISFAKKIPAQTTAHTQVESRIQRWSTVWAKGEKVFKKAETALKDEDWRGAFSIMVGLLSIDSRYWAQTQYEFLNQKIIVAQKDETQLVKAKRLLEIGGIDNLTKALELVQNLSEGTIFQKSVQETVVKVSKSLVNIAEVALGREDLTTALNALEQIPRSVSFWPEVQDWTDIANAMSDSWSGSVVGYERAIANLKKMSPQRPLYFKAQDYIQKWSADIAYVRLLEEARAKVAGGSTQELGLALDLARQIPSDSNQWKSAQQDIKAWAVDLSNQQDQPILDRADELSFRGDPASLRAAIRTAQQIGSGTPLYTEAQNRIKGWQDQLNSGASRGASAASETTAATGSADQETQALFQEAQRMAQKSTPAALASAIETASQVPAQSALYAEAQQSIAAWGDQMLELATSKANYDLKSAIAIAQQIPAAAPAYSTAQQQIQTWEAAAASAPVPQVKPSDP
jgi:hypothetical protein